VSCFQALEIPSDALVVGVENPECFTKAGRLLHLFPAQELVFVLRYGSNNLLQWLESIENPYLHFGDFDPAGIAIYLDQYLTRLRESRCQFLVPPNIKKLLEQKGSAALFDQQQNLWPPKQCIQQETLRQLIHAIASTGRGLEQEALLTSA